MQVPAKPRDMRARERHQAARMGKGCLSQGWCPSRPDGGWEEGRGEDAQFGCKRKRSAEGKERKACWGGEGWPAAGMTKCQSERGGLPNWLGEALRRSEEQQ